MSWRRTDEDELLPLEPRKRGNGRIRAALAILAVAAGGWYFATHYGPGLSREPSRARWAGDQTPAAPAPTGRIARPSTDTAGGPSPGPAAQAEGDRARAIIAELRQEGSPGLSRAYAQAEAFRDSERPADAYLLYFYAARQGHVPSALALGAMADPQSFVAGTSLLDAPDMAQAYKWYKVAADQGDATARQRLASLRQRAEAAAAGGDEQARRLLLEWR